MQHERQTLTVEEAAKLLGVSRGSAYEPVRVGELPVVRLGRRLLVPREALSGYWLRPVRAVSRPPKSATKWRTAAGPETRPRLSSQRSRR